MLVTFRTDAHESITFFGEVAARLLNMMGHSGTVPGAILAADVAPALASLRHGLLREQPHDAMPSDAGDSDVSMTHRALPLIALLEAAVAHQDDVLWS